MPFGRPLSAALCANKKGENMTKKVFALWGRADVGKSGTIKKACELLTSKYKNAKKEYGIWGDVDIRVVLTINGIKIGIEGQGDPGGRLEKSLSLFIKVGCKVIICATRIRGQTVEAVNALAKHSYEAIWFEQVISDSSEQESSNLAMAKQLMKETEKIINA
jgi:hypothetical protein